MDGSHIRVEVRQPPAGDPILAAELNAMRRRSRRLIPVVVPLIVVIIVVMVLALIRRSEGGAVETVVVTIGSLVLIAVASGWLFRRQARRALHVPDRLWSSRPALYLGPYDDDGGIGLAGSAEFARRHTGEGNALIVRLVLTSTEMLVVPTRGKNQPLATELAAIGVIAVTRAGRTDSGLTIRRRDGRAATFLVQTDEGLIAALQGVGARVTEII